MKIAVGFDDKTEITDRVVEYLKNKEFDYKLFEIEAWPDVAVKVAEAVAGGQFDQGIILCWTGTGSSMAANKVKGIRAALVWQPWIAEGARKWNDANIIVMSSKKTELSLVDKILDAWFSVKYPDSDELKNIKKLR